MKAVYKTRCVGPYHIENNTPCQDSCSYKISDKGYTVAAVADGLGSCKHSDVASQIAAESVVNVCAGKLEPEMNETEILEIMKNAFMVADANIFNTVNANDGNHSEYETTLCLAVYDGKTLYYGQAGDSGMIALTSEGEYIPVTSQQRDDEGAVYPLSFGLGSWVFGKVEKDVSAFALMTDGILDTLFHPLLRYEDVKMNIPLAERMLNYFEIEEQEVPELEKIMSEYWENCPEKIINDDKTTVCVINTDFVPSRQNEEYYKDPDWDALKAKEQKRRQEIREKLAEEEAKASTESSDKNTEIKLSLTHDTTNVQNEKTVEDVVDEIVQTTKENFKNGVDKISTIISTIKDEMSEKPTEKVEKHPVDNTVNPIFTKIDIKI